jgi:SNF2 family DNA or RNA helicase
MTGTLMQNNHEELWNLVNLVQPGHFGDWDSFKGHISLPILFGRYV